MDREKLREFLKKADEVGERLFNELFEEVNKIAEDLDIGDPKITECMIDHIAKSIITSAVLTGIANGNDLSQEEIDKLGDEINNDIREVTQKYHLRYGATIVGVDLKELTDEEEEEESHDE